MQVSVLVLRVDVLVLVLEFTHTATKKCFTKSDAILAKYLATINHEEFMLMN